VAAAAADNPSAALETAERCGLTAEVREARCGLVAGTRAALVSEVLLAGRAEVFRVLRVLRVTRPEPTYN
jgi:hypothetical protein